MKENIFNLIPRAEDIIKSKSFDELSEVEKSQFLQYLSKEEYGSIRHNLLMVKSLFCEEEKSILTDKEIKNKLLSVFPKNKISFQIYNFIVNLLNIKIPAYQMIIILIIGIILFIRFKNSGSESQTTQNKVDTVYVERSINIHSEDESNFNTYKKIKKETGNTEIKIKRNDMVLNIKNKEEKQNIILKQNLNILLNNINLAQNTKTGRTLENDKDIYRILVTAQ